MVLICNDNDCSQKKFIKKISSKGVFVTTVTPTPSSSSSPIFDAIAVKPKKIFVSPTDEPDTHVLPHQICTIVSFCSLCHIQLCM